MDEGTEFIKEVCGWTLKVRRLEEENRALRAHVERLRDEITEIHSGLCRAMAEPPGIEYAELVQAATCCETLLAATPAQSLAAVKVAVLREVAEKWEKRGDDCLKRASVNLRATADRIEKEAGRG